MSICQNLIFNLKLTQNKLASLQNERAIYYADRSAAGMMTMARIKDQIASEHLNILELKKIIDKNCTDKLD